MISQSSYFAAALALFNVAAAKLAPRNSNIWLDTWVSMPQLTEYNNLPPAPYNQSGIVFVNSTIRQTIHTTLGGSDIRITFSNAFGLTDLPITAVTVALPTNGSSGASSIDTHTLHTVTFSGDKNFTIPNGALVVSDPIPMSVKPQSELTVTMYLATGQTTNAITSHPGSRATTWLSQGNYVTAAKLTDPSVTSLAHWYFLSAVEVLTTPNSKGFVIIGDSITDGRASDTDGNDRWPDLLLARMQQDHRTSSISVLNQAAGGNRILYDGLGPNALGRVDRDVLGHANIAYAMIFEGVNDIGTAATDAATQQVVGDRIIAAYKQIATRLSDFGIPFFAATITPFSAPDYNTTVEAYSDPTREKTRQRVNDFIRSTDIFDAVIDFDEFLRDPQRHYTLDPSLQSGDWLHPNETGYHKIANMFPLNVFWEN